MIGSGIIDAKGVCPGDGGKQGGGWILKESIVFVMFHDSFRVSCGSWTAAIPADRALSGEHSQALKEVAGGKRMEPHQGQALVGEVRQASWLQENMLLVWCRPPRWVMYSQEWTALTTENSPPLRPPFLSDK